MSCSLERMRHSVKPRAHSKEQTGHSVGRMGHSQERTSYSREWTIHSGALLTHFRARLTRHRMRGTALEARIAGYAVAVTRSVGRGATASVQQVSGPPSYTEHLPRLPIWQRKRWASARAAGDHHMLHPVPSLRPCKRGSIRPLLWHRSCYTELAICPHRMEANPDRAARERRARSQASQIHCTQHISSSADTSSIRSGRPPRAMTGGCSHCRAEPLPCR